MGEALLIPFGINLSSAAFAVLVSNLRERIYPKRRAFLSAVSAHLRRDAGLHLAPGVLEHVIFDMGAFSALLRREPAPSNWDSILFDLLTPGGMISGQQLADLLYEAIMTEGGLDVHMLLVDGINDLKDGQGAIYSELLELRDLVERASDTGASEAATVHQSINSHLSKVRAAIGELTAEQMYVIRTLHGVRRALVPGTAGSGKTVVACEKALRLADAGLKTLLLCHNPWLAGHLEEMTKGSLVEVRAFDDWVATLVGDQRSRAAEWQRHEEPSEAMLWAALDNLLGDHPGWQAVIVDEGQDFRTDWWILVDAAVDSSGFLYVFADDQQRLHSADREYPRFDQTYTLSRNCRNSGPVYTAMRALVPGLSRHEQALAHLGGAAVVFTDAGRASDGLARATAEVHGTSGDESVVVLTMDGQVEAVCSTNARILTERPVGWRRGVAAATRRVIEEARSHPWYLAGASDDAELLAPLDDLSYGATPSDDDLELIADLANVLIDRTPKLDWNGTSSPVRFVADGGEITITRPGPRYWHARVKYLASKEWRNDIPAPSFLALEPYAEPTPARSGRAAVHTIAGFKGREADTVVVVWEPHLSPDPLTELYVAVSRARLRSIVVAPATARGVLPKRLLERVSVIDLAPLPAEEVEE